MRSKASKVVLGFLGAAAMVVGLTVDMAPALRLWSGVARAIGQMNQDLLRVLVVVLGLSAIAVAWLHQNRDSRKILARIRGASDAERVFLRSFTAPDQANALDGPLMVHVDAAYQLLADGILTSVDPSTPSQAETLKGLRLSDEAIDALAGFIDGSAIKRQTIYLNIASIGYRLAREDAAKKRLAQP